MVEESQGNGLYNFIIKMIVSIYIFLQFKFFIRWCSVFLCQQVVSLATQNTIQVNRVECDNTKCFSREVHETESKSVTYSLLWQKQLPSKAEVYSKYQGGSMGFGIGI